jgi:phenylacetate-CoA ligase
MSRLSWRTPREAQRSSDETAVTFRPFARLYGSSVIAACALGQQRIPVLPRKKLDALRDRRVRSIVRYAAANVPYYHDMFASSGLDARDVRGVAELDQIPVLEKEFVRDNPELFRSTARPARNALHFLSSGSTGRRLETHHDRRSVLANIAFGERERRPLNQVAGGGFRPKELYVSYETSTFKKVISFYAENTLRAVRPRRVFLPLSTPIEEVIDVMNAEQPDILVGYGGWVDLFFKTLAARDLDVHLPKVVMYIGEALPPGGREYIETRFGVTVLSRYNAVESFKIGYFCEAVSGFHVHEDLCHLRIIDADGAPVPTGTHGRLVLSNLVNRATVLLNYPIGDVAAWAEHACPCGRTFRLLSELSGRVEDLVRLPNGRHVHPREVWAIFKGDVEVLQYQLVQYELGRFTVFLSTLDQAAFERASARALPGLRQLLGSDVDLEIRWRDPATARDKKKFRAVESRIGQTR